MSSVPPTKAEILDIYRRVVSTDYRTKIEADPESLRIFQSLAAQSADLARRIHRTQQAGFFLPSAFQTDQPASNFVRAEFTAQVERTFGHDQIRTIEAGAMIVEDRIFLPPEPGAVAVPVSGGRSYRNKEAITFAVDVGTVADVTFEATATGYSSNLEHLLDEATGFIEDGRLVLKDQSKARANIEASIVSVDIANATLVMEDSGKPDVFSLLDQGLYIRIDQAANLANQGLTLRISGFEQPNVENPLGSGLLPNRIFCEIPAGAVPVVESGSIKWTMLDWKDQGFQLVNTTVPLGGRDSELFLLGDGRGVYQQTDESDASFRQRAARLPDVITPGAIRRAMNRELQPFNFFGLAIDIQDFDGFFWDEDFLDYYTAAGDPIFIGGDGTTVSKLSHGTARAVAIANLALAGVPAPVDGVTLIAGDVILLTNQTLPVENGAYVIAAGAWSRDTNWGFPIGAPVTSAPFLTRVTEGTLFSDSLWVVPATLAPNDVIGVDPLTVAQVLDDTFPTSDLPIDIDTKLLLSLQEAHGWGFIFLPFIGEGEFGFSYDVGPLILLPDATFLGPAWDVGFFNGFAVAGNQAYASIVTNLNEIKLGGVGLTFIRSLELNASC